MDTVNLPENFRYSPKKQPFQSHYIMTMYRYDPAVVILVCCTPDPWAGERLP